MDSRRFICDFAKILIVALTIVTTSLNNQQREEGLGHSQPRAMVDPAKKKQRVMHGGGEVLDESMNRHTGNPYSKKYFDILEKRKDLPVWQQQQDFTNMLSKNQTLILVGETGSGKTTQVPQFVVDAGYTSDGKMCVCTQPRRVAAMSVARRVADEMDVTIGEEVGYSIRFEEATGPKTFLKYSTDGVFLRNVDCTIQDCNLSSCFASSRAASTARVLSANY